MTEPSVLTKVLLRVILYISVAQLFSIPVFGSVREKGEEVAQLSVHAGRSGCMVDIDSTTAGKTDAQGTLVIEEVEATDHYVHIRCPDQDEMSFFISPHADDNVEIHPGSASSIASAPVGSPLEAAQAKIQLRQLLQDAIQMRAKGRLDEAVQNLHDATKLDPENSDLHRELGITFLLVKEWKRARCEMLEAIRLEPGDADAHNGLGYALEKLGQLDAALKQYRTATQLEPDDRSYRQHYVDAMSRVAGEQTARKR